MKKQFTQSVLAVACALFTINCMQAQVGIGTTMPNAALEISSATSGILPPQVVLTAVNVSAPVVNPNGGGAPVAGTFVWNTATAGVPPNNVAPGLYYWDGVRWISFAGSPGGLDWSLKGNSGTNNGTDFLGTTDAQPLVIKVNSIERIRMGTAETVVNEDAQNYNFRVEGVGETEMFFVDATNNHVHIRGASPFPTVDMFTSIGDTDDYAINGYANGQGNAAVYGRHDDLSTGIGSVVAGAFDAGQFGYGIIDGYTIGVCAAGNELGALMTSNKDTGDRWGLITRNIDNFFNIGSEARLAGFSEVPRDTGMPSGGGGSSDEYYGGYFTGGQTAGDYAYVGLNYRGTNYKITGAGSVATIVKDTEGKKRILFCPEAPEILFEDYGVAKLNNGEIIINIDPIFAKNIVVNEKHPLKVFIQLEGDCKGVYVTEKSKNSFKVKELSNGKSNIQFSWHIVANRVDDINAAGEIESKHEGVRFPYGPDKLKPLKYGKAKIGKRGE